MLGTIKKIIQLSFLTLILFIVSVAYNLFSERKTSGELATFLGAPKVHADTPIGGGGTEGCDDGGCSGSAGSAGSSGCCSSNAM